MSRIAVKRLSPPRYCGDPPLNILGAPPVSSVFYERTVRLALDDFDARVGQNSGSSGEQERVSGMQVDPDDRHARKVIHFL